VSTATDTDPAGDLAVAAMVEATGGAESHRPCEDTVTHQGPLHPRNVWAGTAARREGRGGGAATFVRVDVPSGVPRPTPYAFAVRAGGRWPRTGAVPAGVRGATGRLGPGGGAWQWSVCATGAGRATEYRATPPAAACPEGGVCEGGRVRAIAKAGLWR
jgi:hypothetical protein